ncbi:MAG: HAMP domain-containing protein [Burkholderiaceae bacterium]|nr:MAG: HAMP domain-containing protein [Burkholderiaceae bacterium]
MSRETTMIKRRLSSLQSQLISLLLALITVVWLVIIALVWRDASHEVDEILDSHLAQAASLLVVQQAQDLSEQERALDTPLLHHYAPRVMFQVFHEGRLSLRSANAPHTALIALTPNTLTGYQTLRFQDDDWRVFLTQGAEQDVTVLVAEKQSARLDVLNAVMRSMAAPMLLALPLLALCIWWAVRRGLTPLVKLSQLLQSKPAGDLELIQIDHHTKELQALIDSLNQLLQANASLLVAEKSFTANAAHELRTPIAAIRMQAQVASQANEQEQQQALGNMLIACDRANRTIEQLLTLARLDQSTALQTETVDLAELTRQIMSDLAVKSISKRQSISFDVKQDIEGAQDFSTKANATLIGVLLRNLIDNAIRYCPESANIELSLYREHGTVVLQIADDGPGLSDQAMQKLGERFFRVLGTHESGSGLGWSIIKRIAEVSNITVHTSHSSAQGGLTVQLVFSEEDPEHAFQ